MIFLIRNLLAVIVFLTGFPYFIREFIQSKKVTILCYHNPSPEKFDEQIGYLSKNYHIISLQKFIKYKNENKLHLLPPKSIIITLDDGYKENFNLLKVLKKYDAHCSIFLTTSLVNTKKNYWFNEVPEDEKVTFKKIQDSKRLELMKNYSNSSFDTRYSLNSEEIHEMKNNNFSFQSHTLTHPILSNCKPKKILKELYVSKKYINKKINLCNSIAYPNGSYSSEVLCLVKACNYKAALTTNPGFNDNQTDIHQLKRIVVGDDKPSLFYFAIQITGVFKFLKKGFS